MQSMETHTLHPYRNSYLTSCTKLSFGEMKLLFSVKNYCPLICLIRRGLEKERLYQISSQIWRQAAPGGCCSLLQPSSWWRNLSSPEADPITASPEETGPEENTAYTNKLTSSSSARSCFLLSIQPFSLSLLFVSPFLLKGKPISRFMKLGKTAADHSSKSKTYASMSSRSKDQLGTDKKGLLKNISNEHTQKPQENKT